MEPFTALTSTGTTTECKHIALSHITTATNEMLVSTTTFVAIATLLGQVSCFHHLPGPD